MRILIIGKNGQLGQEIDHLAKEFKFETFAFGKQELDILDYKRTEKLIKKISPDVVINTAAYHVVSDCEQFPEKAFAVNAAAEKKLADTCHQNKIKLVYYSTDKVFDGKKRSPYKESEPATPIQIYGLSKLAGEIATTNYCPNSIIIRTCGIFGGVAGSREKKGNFVLYILQQAKKGKQIEISSEQVVNFVYAKDLAFATLMLLRRKAKNGTYNIVNERSATWARFAQEIVKIRKLNFKIVPVDRGGSFGSVPTPIYTALDTTKIKNCDIKLSDWRDALKRYLDFLEMNGL